MRSVVLTCSFAPALTGKARAQDPHAGHASEQFLRAQSDRNGANLHATEQAWPRTIEFILQNTK